MKAHDLMRDILKRTSAKLVSSEMGLSLSLVYQWAIEATSIHSPLTRTAQLIHSTGDGRIVQWMAEQLALSPNRPKPNMSRRDPTSHRIVYVMHRATA